LIAFIVVPCNHFFLSLREKSNIMVLINNLYSTNLVGAFHELREGNPR